MFKAVSSRASSKLRTEVGQIRRSVFLSVNVSMIFE